MTSLCYTNWRHNRCFAQMLPDHDQTAASIIHGQGVDGGVNMWKQRWSRELPRMPGDLPTKGLILQEGRLRKNGLK